MPTDRTTRATIAPILSDTYGDGAYVDAFAGHLAAKIETWADDPISGDRTREDMICLACWDWFSGGTTAAIVAAKIERALGTSDRGSGFTDPQPITSKAAEFPF